MTRFPFYGLSLPGLLLLGAGAHAQVRFQADLGDAGRYRFEPRDGHVLLINYWATWCGPCRQEMPLLDTLYRKYHDRGLDVIGISLDEASDAARMRQVGRQVSYPVVMAEQATLEGASRVWGVPMNYLLDAEGRAVLDGEPGFAPADAPRLEQRIRQLLEASVPQSKR